MGRDLKHRFSGLRIHGSRETIRRVHGAKKVLVTLAGVMRMFFGLFNP